MSLPLIREALETALDGISPAIETFWPNDPERDAPAALCQYVALLLGQPINDAIGPGWIKRGYFQVTVSAPTGENTADTDARLALIEAAFASGESLSAGPQVVMIDRSPEILRPYRDGDRRNVPVRIRFFAPDSSPPAGYAYLIDGDGAYLVDSDGDFLIALAA